MIEKESPRGKFKHLYGQSTEVQWMLTTTEWLKMECGFHQSDTQVFVSPDLTTFHFQIDYKNKGTGRNEPRGQLDPAIAVIMRDVYVLHDNLDDFAIVGPEYKWAQYLASLPRDCVTAIYDQGYRDGKLGDYLEIHARKPPKELACLLGSGIAETDQVAMVAGRVIRPGMCVEFCTDFASSGSQEALDHSMIQNLQGAITAIDRGDEVVVRVLLSRWNLPPSMNWPSLGSDQVFQTDIFMRVQLNQITNVVRIMPHQLYQDGCSIDVNGQRVAHSDFVVVGHITVHGPVSDSAELLKTLPTSKLIIDRIKPLQHADAFHILHMTNLLFGIGGRAPCVYQQYLSAAVTEFALSKCLRANDTRRDNTLHLNIFGPVLMSLLHEELLWNDSCLKMQECVTIEDGTIIVTLPTFQDASPLLMNDDGVYDLTNFGYGFVQLYAPIAFKWEMYDTGSGRARASRAVDGFTAITFESYVERDRHNHGLIKGTCSTDERERNANMRQLRLPPSRCPRL